MHSEELNDQKNATGKARNERITDQGMHAVLTILFHHSTVATQGLKLVPLPINA